MAALQGSLLPAHVPAERAKPAAQAVPLLFDLAVVQSLPGNGQKRIANSARELTGKPAEKAGRMAKLRDFLRWIVAMEGATSSVKHLQARIRAATGEDYPTNTVRNWLNGTNEPCHDAWVHLRQTFGAGLYDAVHFPDSRDAEAWVRMLRAGQVPR